jgi:class 3 adenylate cyclase
MVALYRCGRQADALRAYRRLREQLGEELGIEPGAELVALEEAVLLQKPDLAWSRPDDGRSHERRAALADAVASASDAERPKPSLPSGVVTFVLTDIVGSTALWDAHPRDMAGALERHDELITKAVTAHGGVVLKSKGEGDSTMSVFARASDAVAAAVDLQRKVEDVAWPEGTDLKIRVAVHTGEAHERDGDYFGPTLNRAARLRALATGGQVLCTAVTATVVRDLLPEEEEVRDRGEHQLPGLSRPERIFEIRIRELEERPLRPRTTPLRLAIPPELAAGSASPFVGRQTELASLKRQWEQSDESTRVVLIAGEPGIGKSRLAAEFAATVHGSGALVLYGRCDEDLGVPYQPFAEAFRFLTDELPVDQCSSLLRGMPGALAWLDPARADIVPSLPPVAHIDPDTDRYCLFQAVVAWLAETARRSPTALILDDLHWATQPTLLLLRHVARAVGPAQLLIIGTYRATEVDRSHPLMGLVAELRQRPGVERVELTGLSNDEVSELVAAKAGAEGHLSSGAVVKRLAAATGGNPFFLGEVLANLAESGAIRDASGRQSLGMAVDDVGPPDSVRDVILRRLGRLSKTANRTLTVGAVIGATFSLAMLERLHVDANEPSDLFDALEEALDAGLLQESPAGFGFPHALVRETLYAGLSDARRARLHHQVARALEALPHRDVTQIDVGALAFHFRQALPEGTAKEAAHYGLLAARQSLERLAPEDSLSYAESGVHALDQLNEDDVDLRCDLLQSIADAELFLSDRREARAAALQAAALARQVQSADRLAQATSTLASAAAFGVEDPETQHLCEEALELLGPGDELLRTQLLATLATSYNSAGDSSTAAPLAHEAVIRGRQLGDGRVLLHALQAYQVSQLSSPAFETQRSISDEHVALAERIGHPLGLVVAHGWRLVLNLVNGDMPAFHAEWKKVEAAAKRIDWRLLPPLERHAQAMLALLEGRLDEVEPLATRALELGSGMTDRASFLLQLFWLRFEQGRLDEVQALAEGFVAGHPEQWVIRSLLVMLYAELQQTKAIDLMDDYAATDFEGLPWGAVGPIAQIALSYTAAKLGRVVDAGVLYDRLKPFQGHLAVAGTATLCLGPFDHYLGMLAACSGQWQQADTHYNAAISLEERTGSAAMLARTRLWQAKALFASKTGRDPSRAVRLAAAALADGTDIGMTGVIREARQVIAAARATDA